MTLILESNDIDIQDVSCFPTCSPSTFMDITKPWPFWLTSHIQQQQQQKMV